MKINFLKPFLLIVALAIVLMMPNYNYILATHECVGGTPPVITPPVDGQCVAGSAPQAHGDAEADSGKLDNPIGVATILDFVKKIFDIIWKIGIPVIAIFIIYSGFRFVQAQGKPEELTKAKKAFMAVLIGAAIVLGAWVLASAIGQTIQKLQKSQAFNGEFIKLSSYQVIKL